MADISVIIPVRNGQRYLRDAIESALCQTHAPTEIIVVDNDSTDLSRDEALRFGPPVRVLDEPVHGPAQARNTGIRAATGSLIAFLDADDLWEPPKLERQMQVLDAHLEIDMVFTNLREFLSPEIGDEMKPGLRSEDYAGIAPSTMLARLSCFRSAGLLPELPIGEFIAWYGLAQTAGLRSQVIPEVLVRRRVHLANTTLRHRHDRGGYLKAAKLVLDSRRGRNRAQGA